MKRLLVIFTAVLFNQGLYSQALSWVEIGSEPAYCRLYFYQSGNGIVYATAAGGTAPIDYLWTNLTTGETSTNTTWGGLNPAQYKIEATDAVGATLVDTVMLDSVNVVANFDEISGNLLPMPTGYSGFFYEIAQFVSTSTGVNNLNDPLDDTTFFWHTGLSTSSWMIFHDHGGPSESYTVGTYEVTLVAQNKNGCSDSISKEIHIFGPAGIDDAGEADALITIHSSEDDNKLYFKQIGFKEELLVEIYTLSGQAILEFETESNMSAIDFNAPQGIYLYKVTGRISKTEVATGKLKH